MTETDLKTKDEWEPRILGFGCNWCSYAGADLAGVSRLQMPPNFRLVRVMCSGRVDPLFILNALESGADGVIVMGCHPGDCHYISGNLKAERRAKFLDAILEQLGLKDRFELHWVSASEGPKFQETITNFTKKIKDLGPSPVNLSPEKVEISKDSQKREHIRDALVSLARAMDFHPESPIEFEENDVMEGYGFPKWNEDECIGCGTCYLNCPEGVIKMDDRDGWRYIGHNSYDCRTCRICEEMCPQDAIEIKHGFDLTQFLEGGVVEDVHMSLRVCSVCNETFATDRQLDTVKSKIEDGDAEKNVPGMILPDHIFEVCPKCKLIKKANVEGVKQ